MKITQLVVMCVITFSLAGCGYSEEEVASMIYDERIAAMQSTKAQVLSEMEDAVQYCESSLNGVLFDDGCLEDECSYGGDPYDCEMYPDFAIVDGDCLRQAIGI